jgi:hypothetical protein
MTTSLFLILFEIEMKIFMIAYFVLFFLVFAREGLFLNLGFLFDLKNFITLFSVLLYNFINFRLCPGFLIIFCLFRLISFTFLILNSLSIRLIFQVK